MGKRPVSGQNKAIWTDTRSDCSFFVSAIAGFKGPKIFKERSRGIIANTFENSFVNAKVPTRCLQSRGELAGRRMSAPRCFLWGIIHEGYRDLFLLLPLIYIRLGNAFYG